MESGNIADDGQPAVGAGSAPRLQVQAHWYSLPEAATVLHISETAVRKQIAAGRLTGVRAGRGWRVLLPGKPLLHASVAPGIDRARGQPSPPAPDALIPLVRDLQRQNLALAGHIGYLQSQLTQSREETKRLEHRQAQLAAEGEGWVGREEHEAVLTEAAELRARIAAHERAVDTEQARKHPIRWWPWRRKQT